MTEQIIIEGTETVECVETEIQKKRRLAAEAKAARKAEREAKAEAKAKAKAEAEAIAEAARVARQAKADRFHVRHDSTLSDGARWWHRNGDVSVFEFGVWKVSN